jgi:hypothetical protein
VSKWLFSNLSSVWLQKHLIYRYVVAHTTMIDYQCRYITIQYMHVKLYFPMYNNQWNPPIITDYAFGCINGHAVPNSGWQNTILFHVIVYLLYFVIIRLYTRFLCTYNTGTGIEFAEAGNNFIFVDINIS